MYLQLDMQEPTSILFPSQTVTLDHAEDWLQTNKIKEATQSVGSQGSYGYFSQVCVVLPTGLNSPWLMHTSFWSGWSLEDNC